MKKSIRKSIKNRENQERYNDRKVKIREMGRERDGKDGISQNNLVIVRRH